MASSKLRETGSATPSVTPFGTATLRPSPFSLYLYGLFEVVRSLGSCPAMDSSTMPQQSAVWQRGPSLSRVQLRAMAPCLLTLP